MRLTGAGLRPLDERGTIWDALIGAAVVVLGLGATLTGTVAVSHFAHQTIPAEAQLVDLGNLIDGTTRDAHWSIALLRGTSVGNNDNGDGHELDFYVRDAQGPAISGLLFSRQLRRMQSSQPLSSVARYHYAWPDLVQNGGGGAAYDGGAVPNIATFSARTVAASQLLDPNVNPYSASYLTAAGITHITDVAQATGYPGVTSGNSVTIVTASNASGTRSVHLLARQLAPSRTVPVATYTPSPNPFTLSTGSIDFRNPIAPAKTVTLSEANYGTRTTIPPRNVCDLRRYLQTGDERGAGLATDARHRRVGQRRRDVNADQAAHERRKLRVYTFTDNAPQNDVLHVHGREHVRAFDRRAAGRLRPLGECVERAGQCGCLPNAITT